MPERQTAPAPEADVFFEVFETARVKGGTVAQAVLAPGQSLSFAQPSVAHFHVVDGAPCLLYVGRGKAVALRDGDLVVLPRGQAHRLQASAGAARVTTGEFRLVGPTAKMLTDALPAVLHAGTGQAPPSFPQDPAQWLSVTLAAIRLEAERPSLGSGVMLSRLVDLLFVWSIRHWLASVPARQKGWFAALGDPVAGPALALMHAHPARPWSVDMLARSLHQSRSGFSARFASLVGEPPMRYLARWRMQLATELLTASGLRISQVAQRVGYDSEPAFSRAFRRHVGMAPVDYRRQQKQP